MNGLSSLTLTPKRIVGGVLTLSGLLLAVSFAAQSPPRALLDLDPVYQQEFTRAKTWKVAGCALLAVVGAALMLTQYKGSGLTPSEANTVRLRFGVSLLTLGLVCAVGPFFGLVPKGLAQSAGKIEPWFIQILGLGLSLVGGLVLGLGSRTAQKAERAVGPKPDKPRSRQKPKAKTTKKKRVAKAKRSKSRRRERATASGSP